MDQDIDIWNQPEHHVDALQQWDKSVSFPCPQMGHTIIGFEGIR